ncbi:MAG: bifunctional diguanylate cyclase/phosphodiesterase [Actinobacteria bacterium]|nr:bifunctional diguanylate cyclase/phosphodiesterase [Actinomycetota bacterium]
MAHLTVVDAEAAAAAEAAADPIVAVGVDGSIVYANPATRELLKCRSLVGKNLDSMVTVAGGRSLSSVLGSTPQRVLVEVAPDSGEVFEAELSVNPSVELGGRRWVLVMHQLPRQEMSIRELLRRATHDDLTSMANRSYLVERIDATFRDPHTADVAHGLVVLDLDGFKQINDTFGHDAGDAVLVAIGSRLLGLCRPGDVVARLGGDEFAAWCHNLGDRGVAGLTRRLASVFADPVEFGELRIEVSGSLGATTSSFARDPSELLRQADIAMYRAKASGRDRYVIFDAPMAAEQRERGARERDIRRALSTEQFVSDFQPIVNLTTGEVVGVEALARWDHPRLGQLQPREFIPLVESTLLYDEFDTLMIKIACGQLAAWQDQLTKPLSVWINVSPNHLSDAFVEDLSTLIDDLQLIADRLVIELPEDATIATPNRVAVLESLHAIGVRIAIDDFGTGDSQLSYLPDLPIDFVKLDQSFIQGIADRPEKQVLASSLIGLAHGLESEVVAEGVETREDLDVLKRLGCDLAQGFLLARPRPADDVPGIYGRDVIDLR